MTPAARLRGWCHDCHQLVDVAPDRRVLAHHAEGVPCTGEGSLVAFATPAVTRPVGDRGGAL
jgi:hypothetical protein